MDPWIIDHDLARDDARRLHLAALRDELDRVENADRAPRWLAWLGILLLLSGIAATVWGWVR